MVYNDGYMKQSQTAPVKQQYQYVITLTEPRWPRKLAEELQLSRYFAERLMSVTDLQNSTHVYGPTYVVAEHRE